MYRINRLSRPVLITPDEVIAKAMVDENVDIRYILNSIEVAEDRFIAPALGLTMYTDLVNEKNVVVTDVNHDDLVSAINASLEAVGKPPIAGSQLVNGMYVNAIEECSTENYETLWNWKLWRVVAEAVHLMMLVPSWTRSTGQGEQQNNPKTITGTGEGSGTAGIKDVQYKLDHMAQARLYPLIAEMKQWICQTGGYTLFDCNCLKSDDGISKRQGGILLDIYEEHNVNGPDMWQWPYNERRNGRYE